MSEQYSILASILQHHGARFFADDPSLWKDVRQHRELENQQRENEEVSRQAESAFNANDWQQAIQLLEILGDDRTKLQSARLAFARKRNAK